MMTSTPPTSISTSNPPPPQPPSLQTQSPPFIDHIVALEECHCAIPTFSIPHTYTGYHNTLPHETASRIHDASIIITSRVLITRSLLAQCSPNLRLIAIMAAGYDGMDIEACKERGVTVCNIPSASAESVAEHAVALVLAVKRRVVEMDQLTKKGEEWPRLRTAIHRFGALPGTWKTDIVGIVGFGTLGRRIEGIVKALGMSVLRAERKRAPSPREGRTNFFEVLTKSTIIILCCPLDATTRSMISEPELRAMNKETILINVSRGGVVEERPLVKALKEGWIKGAATDVFESEPASAGSPLLEDGIPNLTLSPHIAWYAESSIENLQATVKSNVENFVVGRPENVI